MSRQIESFRFESVLTLSQKEDSIETLLYFVKKPVDHGVVTRKILSSPDSTIFTATHDDG